MGVRGVALGSFGGTGARLDHLLAMTRSVAKGFVTQVVVTFVCALTLFIWCDSFIETAVPLSLWGSGLFASVSLLESVSRRARVWVALLLAGASGLIVSVVVRVGIEAGPVLGSVLVDGSEWDPLAPWAIVIEEFAINGMTCEAATAAEVGGVVAIWQFAARSERMLPRVAAALAFALLVELYTANSYLLPESFWLSTELDLFRPLAWSFVAGGLAAAWVAGDTSHRADEHDRIGEGHDRLR